MRMGAGSQEEPGRKGRSLYRNTHLLGAGIDSWSHMTVRSKKGHLRGSDRKPGSLIRSQAGFPDQITSWFPWSDHKLVSVLSLGKEEKDS